MDCLGSKVVLFKKEVRNTKVIAGTLLLEFHRSIMPSRIGYSKNSNRIIVILKTATATVDYSSSA